MIGYQAQVIPAIFAGLLLSFLELRLRKIIPNAISMIVVPFLSTCSNSIDCSYCSWTDRLENRLCDF